MKNFSLGRAKGLVCLLAGTACAVSAHAAGHSCHYKPQVNVTRLQQNQITGTAGDSRGPLPGVTVAVKGKPVVAITDAEGHFSVAANINDVLVFSFVGYKTVELTVNNLSPLRIILAEDETALQEVTVNAGYYNVKESERTGSIAKLSGAAIEKQPVSNVLASMQGRMAGVSISQNTGTPGGGFDIQIRGLNSLRNEGNAPLFIIDGVPYSSETIGYSLSNTVLPQATSPLNNLNPGDIESIEVLKDADATAIYGSRGANGVVLVSTKKGKQGKTRVSVTVSKGYGEVTRFMKLMNTRQYLAMRAEAFANDGISEYPETAYDINGTWEQDRYTDWQEKLLGGMAQIANVQSSLSGGSEQTQFLLSGNFNKETTVFPGDFAYQKGNLRLNLNHSSRDQKFRLAFSAGYTLQDNDQPSTDLTPSAWSTPPNAPALHDENGNLNWENNTFNNPLRHLNGASLSKTNDLVANATLSYQLPYGMEARANFGFTDLRHKESSTFPSTTYDPALNLGPDYSSIYTSQTARQSWIIEPQLNWKREFGKAKVELLAGGTFQKQTNSQLAQGGSGFSSNSLIYNLGAASFLQVFLDDESIYKYQAFFGRANFNWDKRFILNLTGRRDGSSRFGPGRQFATFGAAGAAWIFSNEKWLEGNGLISFGKLRASYGTTGNDQIGNYQFLDTYSSTGINYQNVVGLQPTRLYNPDFGWEDNKKLEIALETSFLKDRIFLTWAWYRNRSSSQLVGIPLPATTGFTTLQANLDATVENSGVELTLRTVNVRTKDFSWIANFNVSVAQNKLLSFPDLENSTFANQYVVGQPLNISKVYHYTGLDPGTGLYTFEDVNGDGVITSPHDQQTIKDLNPKYFGGLQNQFKYGPWQLDFLFQFVKQENYNSIAMFSRPGTMINQPSEVVHHWQSAGDSGPYQLYTSGANDATVEAFDHYISSDAAISDASYIRLKNISLTYDVPQRWTKSMQCRLSLQGQNVLTITPYRGADPEFRNLGFLPPLRVFTAGLQLNF